MPEYNHNEHYATLLLRQVPANCQQALDIGCGDGSFVRRLASHAHISVTGIDPSHAMIKLANANVAGPPLPCNFIEGDFLQYPFEEQFDFISASASIHHMPFDQAIQKMISLLQPGGVLAILGLYREVGLTDQAFSLASIPINFFYSYTRGWPYSKAPIKQPDMSIAEIRAHIAATLPDARLRRLLLWRYLLIWHKPH